MVVVQECGGSSRSCRSSRSSSSSSTSSMEVLCTCSPELPALLVRFMLPAPVTRASQRRAGATHTHNKGRDRVGERRDAWRMRGGETGWVEDEGGETGWMEDASEMQGAGGRRDGMRMIDGV